MPTLIRLKRVGRKKQATFRIVVTNSSVGTAGPSIERLGLYNPRTDPSFIRLDVARTLHWLKEGARPSDSVRSLLRRTGVWEQFHAGVEPEELLEPVLELGPSPAERKTSRRGKVEAPAKQKAKATETEAEEATAEAEPVEAEPEEPEPADEEEEAAAEAEEEPVAAAEAEEEPAAEEADEEEAEEEPKKKAEAPKAEAAAEDEEEEGGEAEDDEEDDQDDEED